MMGAVELSNGGYTVGETTNQPFQLLFNRFLPKLASREGMKALFILFVVVYLLIDWGDPFLPGAFVFNPDECVDGVAVEPDRAQELKPALQMNQFRGSFKLLRLEIKTPVDPKTMVNAPDLIVLLPRRDPSFDRSPEGRTEDH